MERLVRWHNLRLRTKGLFVVAVPAMATIIIACASYVIGDRAADAEREVNRSLRVGQEIQRLKFIEAESAVQVRGYFISGENVYAAQARESLAEFDVTRQKLADLVNGNPTDSERLDRIATIQRSRVQRVISDTTRFQWNALQGNELRAAMKDAEQERAEIDTILKATEDQENRILQARSRRVDALRAALRYVTAICLFLGVTGGVGISILFAVGITDRIRKLQQNVAGMVTGGRVEPLPKGRDEIGVLSEWVAWTARVLRHRTAALENASHGIAQADAAGRYLNFNPAYGKLTGLADIHSASSVTATVHPDDRLQVDEAVGQMWTHGRAEIEVRVVHPEGRVAYLGMTFVSMPEEREAGPDVSAEEEPETGYFVFLHDENRRKEAEAALVHAKDAAVASNLAKSQFLAKISHDIRTPLNAILGAAELLAQSPLDADQTEHVHMFQRNSRRLVSLINDFLDFSKIEAGAVRVENVPYQVRATVEEAVATFRESANRKGITLQAEIGEDVPDWELGDALRVHQVLVNLLSNAMKFTREGRVDVRVSRTTQPEGERLRFAVSDTGPGIRNEDQQRIFAVFAQSGKPDLSSSDGCGLGLAICRELVELMGGGIAVNSQEGSGSTFYFTLPLVAAEPRDAVEETSESHAQSPRKTEGQTAVRLLIAEDTEDNRLLLNHYLRGAAVELQFAENGLEAVEAVQRGPEFDLILMDMDMPVLDGLGAVKAIRAWQGERGAPLTPIVALSAHAMQGAVRDCLDAGCVCHVAKPVDQVTLLKTIQRYARRARKAAICISEGVAALVPKYLGSKLKQVEEARANLAAKDLDPIRRFGHNLKGTGLGYGFPQIEEIGTELEQAAIDLDERSIAEQLDVLAHFLAEEHKTALYH